MQRLQRAHVVAHRLGELEVARRDDDAQGVRHEGREGRFSDSGSRLRPLADALSAVSELTVALATTAARRTMSPM